MATTLDALEGLPIWRRSPSVTFAPVAVSALASNDGVTGGEETNMTVEMNRMCTPPESQGYRSGFRVLQRRMLQNFAATLCRIATSAPAIPSGVLSESPLKSREMRYFIDW
jgi:hypothetical protein